MGSHLAVCKADRASGERPNGTRYISMQLTPRFCTVEISGALTIFHPSPWLSPLHVRG